MGGHMHGGAHNLTVERARLAAAARSSPRSRPMRPPKTRSMRSPHCCTSLIRSTSPGRNRRPAGTSPRGTRLRVTVAYDGERPHMRVMGIAHVYVARGKSPPESCAPPPPDAQSLDAPFAGRPAPPPVDLTLATLAPDGVARPIVRPPGNVLQRPGDARVTVNHFAFSRPNLSIPRGSRITWRFKGETSPRCDARGGSRRLRQPLVSGRRVLVAQVRHARRVPHLLLAAPGLHVAVRPGALNAHPLSVRRSIRPLPTASRAAMTAGPRPIDVNTRQQHEHDRDQREPAGGEHERVGAALARPCARALSGGEARDRTWLRAYRLA